MDWRFSQRGLPRLICCLILFIGGISSLWATKLTLSGRWQPDVLGDGYEMRYVAQPRDFAGPVISTVIRKLAPDSIANGRAVLYVHGFNDYFFNAEMGNEFVSRGYDFYAVDLRRYGRSLLPGQRPFMCRSLNEYFPDIDSAMVAIRRTGIEEVVLMGHSTGGLITSVYMSQTRPPMVKALVLNSPFLDWNQGWKEHLIPLISWIGGIFPDIDIPQGHSTAYAESLLKGDHGEWNYNTTWKMTQSPDVTTGWIRAITLAQKSLRGGKARIDVPILLMYSSASINGSEWTEAHNHADGVLDVNDIRKYGLELGPRVTCLQVNGGLHDLVLSAPAVRAAIYHYLFPWLQKKLPPVPVYEAPEAAA